MTKQESANQITANILRVCALQTGCMATRINNAGIWDEKKQIRRTSTTTRGAADIFACLRGRYVEIEVKAGKDRLSAWQEARKQEVERAGGTYFVVRSTDDFLAWLTAFLKEESLTSYRRRAA